MAKCVARFGALKGSSEAYVDSRLPNHRRTKINLVGMGVVEAESDPALRPAIPLPAHGFNLGMIVAEHGTARRSTPTRPKRRSCRSRAPGR